MVFTHTFDIKVGAVDMEGEIVFNDGNEPSFNTNAPLNDLSMKGLDVFNNLIKAIKNVHSKCGEITKIEFHKKIQGE